LECKGDHPRRFTAEVKNKWTYTSTPPIRVYAVVLNSLNIETNYCHVFMDPASVV
jgi:hypothetical protein